MEFIKQHKGTAIERISPKVLIDDDNYYLSYKRDGRMQQIAYDGDKTVRFWTSGGHEFYNKSMAESIMSCNSIPFHIEGEYTGESNGMLGDRGKSGKETKYRTAFNKREQGPELNDRIFVFDILSFDGVDVRNDPFSARHGMLMQLTFTRRFELVHHVAGHTVEDARIALQTALDDGYEGVMLTHASHTVGTRGRSKTRIKFKETPTGYATIVGTKPGTEAREGTIGSLTVKDEDGLIFSSGGGLNSNEWVLDPEVVGNSGLTIKFAYESIDGGNYIQPRYLGVCLEDKTLVRLNDVL